MSTLLLPIDHSSQFSLDFTTKLNITNKNEHEHEDEEFTFPYSDLSKPLASADELFHDGQIRRTLPLVVEQHGGAGAGAGNFLRPPAKKIFAEKQRDIATPSPPLTAEVSRKRCEKSNSTGFSRLWRLRDLKMRSNSDGKDAFVFLTAESNGVRERKGRGKVKSETVPFGVEKHYVMIRGRRESEKIKRRTYLPYKQHLVGFFTNVNGLSRNVHPF